MTAPQLLIAEDDPDDRMLVEEACATVGLSPRFARDGKELLDLLQVQDAAAQVDLVLLDINMPRVDGRQALRRIREHEQLASLPVVVLTTSRARADRRELTRLGANEYRVKPDSFADLVELIDELRSTWLSHSVPQANGGGSR